MNVCHRVACQNKTSTQKVLINYNKTSQTGFRPRCLSWFVENPYTSINLIHIEPKFGVAVTESLLTHTLSMTCCSITQESAKC